MLALGANGRGRAGLLSALRPQDVFATSLYTGTGASRQNTVGFQPDFVWRKRRNATQSHTLVDALRNSGALSLSTDTTAAEVASSSISSIDLNATGYSDTWNNTSNVVGWSFRRASKFFDIVTYTGDGTSGRVIPHALGIAPGLVIIKRRDAASSWPVAFNVTGASRGLLNTTDAFGTTTGDTPLVNGFIEFQSGVVKLFPGSNGISAVNAAGGTYVAYLFAHDPDTTNGIVQCGSFTGDQTISLGWTPQFLIFKGTDTVSSWLMLDATRGWAGATDPLLLANTSGAEANNTNYITPTATGFTMANIAGGGSGVYLAIRAPI